MRISWFVRSCVFRIRFDSVEKKGDKKVLFNFTSINRNQLTALAFSFVQSHITWGTEGERCPGRTATRREAANTISKRNTKENSIPRGL